MKYKEQLKTERWKQKRQLILERDNYQCTNCNQKENLHVHHKEYHSGKLAWEYDDKYLVTLCKECHNKVHENKDVSEFIKVSDEDYTLINIEANYSIKECYIKYKNNILLPNDSLLLIKGDIGTGKSTILLNFVVGLLGGDDNIGIEYGKTNSSILYFSTEMSKLTLQKRLKNINTIVDTKDKFLMYDISNSTNMFNTVMQLTNKHKPNIVIIDQLGDFVDDVNDSESTAILSKRLIKMINDKGLSIITVIHQNQDNKLNSKARGHLGSLIEQKAFASIAIGKKEDTFIFKPTKIREGSLFFFELEFDEKHNLFKRKANLNRITDIDDNNFLKECFNEKEKSSEEIKTFIQQFKKVGRNKSLGILKEWVNKGLIKRKDESRKSKFILINP